MDIPKIILPSIPMPISTVYNGQTHFLYFMQELPQESNETIRGLIQKEIREIGGLDEDKVNKLIKAQLDQLREELPKDSIKREEFNKILTELQDQIKQQIKEVNDRIAEIESKLSILETQLNELADKHTTNFSELNASLNEISETPPVDTSDFITKAEVDEIKKKLRHEFLKQIQDGSNDVENLLQGLSDYLQLLVLLKKLIEDTQYLIISESVEFKNLSGDKVTRINIINQNFKEIREKVQELNNIKKDDIFGNLNRLVVEINKMISRLKDSIGVLVLQGETQETTQQLTNILDEVEIDIQDLEIEAAKNKYSKKGSCTIM